MLALFSYMCLYRTFYVFYYCTHCCVCQLDTKENDDDDDDAPGWIISVPVYRIVSGLEIMVLENLGF